jgi:hypothetical protein
MNGVQYSFERRSHNFVNEPCPNAGKQLNPRICGDIGLREAIEGLIERQAGAMCADHRRRGRSKRIMELRGAIMVLETKGAPRGHFLSASSLLTIRPWQPFVHAEPSAGVMVMGRDYLIIAGVFVGVAALFAAILGWLGFVQSECLHGTPFLPLIFPCFQ